MVPAAPPRSAGLSSRSTGRCQLPGSCSAEGIPVKGMGLGIDIPPHQGFQANLAVPINPLLIPACLRPRSLQNEQPALEAGGLRGQALSSGSDAGVRGTRVLAVSGSEGAAFSRAPVRQQLVGRRASRSGFRKHRCPSYLGRVQLLTQRQPQPVGTSLPENLALPLQGQYFARLALCCETSVPAAIQVTAGVTKQPFAQILCDSHTSRVHSQALGKQA